MSSLTLFGGLSAGLVLAIGLLVRALARNKDLPNLLEDTPVCTEAQRTAVEQAHWLLPLTVCLLITLTGFGMALVDRYAP